MSTSYTTNCRLGKPATSDRNWDEPLNANADTLDGLTAIGALSVAAAEVPSMTRNVRISTGDYLKADGTIGTYPGAAAVALGASTVTALWLGNDGVLATGPGFPTSAHIRLAEVSTGATAVTGVVDRRIQCGVGGSDLACLPLTGGTLIGGLEVMTPGLAEPLLSVDAVNRRLGFFNSPPATQAPTTASLDDATGGSPSATIGDVGASYSRALINDNLATLAAKVNLLIAAMKRHGLMSP